MTLPRRFAALYKFGGRAYRLSFGLERPQPDTLQILTGAVGRVHDEGLSQPRESVSELDQWPGSWKLPTWTVE